MCGIALTINGNWQETTKMTEAQERRGLENTFHDAGHGIRVGFNRLPITGNYPQPYVGKKYKVWFNGFISNYKELATLHNIPNPSGTDTEVLGEFIERELPFDQLNGFFAIVIVNRADGELQAVTDRHGIKQLYRYTDQDTGTTYIASEIKSILAVTSGHVLQPSAVFDWQYSLGCLTAHTIFRGITKVPRFTAAIPKPITPTYDEAVSHVTLLLAKAIDRNLTSLKSAVFLSGGIDSGFLSQTVNPDYCISMDYQEPELSEIGWIKKQSVAQHVIFQHNSETFDRFADRTLHALDDLRVGACYTNFALTELASKLGVAVLFSGAGSDEIFHSYDHPYSRSIIEVTKRTSLYPLSDLPSFHTHEQYDWAYLRGILTVEDRMSGAFALETRYPYLDNDLVNYVLSLPLEYRTKKLLTDATGMQPRKKKGFSNPITNDQWVNYAYEHLRKQFPIPSIEQDTLNSHNP